MLKELFFVWWFFSPAGVANITAFFSGRNKLLQKYSYPADFYLKFRGKRILGDHKTIRGFVAGTISSILIVYLQIYLYQSFGTIREFVFIDYEAINPVIFGFLSGFGALLGDSVKSFFKRQISINPGRSWVPFDQIDYILGGILLTSIYIRLSIYEYLLLFIVWFFLHPFTTFIGYLAKVKEKPL